MNLRHLARLARLSPSAVSRALRDSPKVSAATKERVLRLAQQHGYRPDPRLSAIMMQLRKPRTKRQSACLGVISFYDALRPWEYSFHSNRVFQAMTRRADELGYRLEPFCLRAPGMNYRRFKSMLKARGIEGLLCFGSPNVDEDFPEELNDFAVVTIGLSIRTHLHRVTSHPYNDTVEALNRLHRLGYRRPGLVLSRYEELRGAHNYSAAYLGWCEHSLGLPHALPILRLDQVEASPLTDWLDGQQPDSLLFVHFHHMLDEFRTVLNQHSVRVPEDLGVAVVTHTLEGTGFAGLQHNQRQLGARAVELLAGHIASRDFGIPANPRLEMVEGKWVDGPSLRHPAVKR